MNKKDLKKLNRRLTGRLNSAIRNSTKANDSSANARVDLTALQRILTTGIPSSDLRRRMQQVSDLSRKALNIKIQGYVVHESVIYKDLGDPRSPFSFPNSSGTGKIFTDAERKKAAKVISKTLYENLKAGAKTFDKRLNVTGMAPDTIVTLMQNSVDNKTKVIFAYDDAKVAVYYYNAKGGGLLDEAEGRVDAYKAFTAWARSIFAKIVSNYDSTHPAVIYIKPNEEWMRTVERLRQTEEYRSSRDDVRKALREDAAANFMNRTGQAAYEGIAFGHTFGKQASQSALFLENPHDIVNQPNLEGLRILGEFAEDVAKELLKVVKTTISLDTQLDVERKYTTSNVHQRLVILVPQNAKTNRDIGSLLTGGATRQNEISRLILDAPDIEGSPSARQAVILATMAKMAGVELSSTKSKKTYKNSVKKTATIEKRAVRGFKGSVTYNRKNPKATLTTDLNSTINLINAKMHDKIQQNMGKGGSKQILNYRTGRFAKSAKLQNLTLAKGKKVPDAAVKYMRYPYGVFEPGGRLHKPGRDPHHIFAKSIRQILQEERIGTFSRVNVKLKG